jgi:hypothetical protein
VQRVEKRHVPIRIPELEAISGQAPFGFEGVPRELYQVMIAFARIESIVRDEGSWKANTFPHDSNRVYETQEGGGAFRRHS